MEFSKGLEKLLKTWPYEQPAHIIKALTNNEFMVVGLYEGKIIYFKEVVPLLPSRIKPFTVDSFQKRCQTS